MNDDMVLPSNELAKIIFFIIIQITSCFFYFWGIIPSIMLLIGYYLSRRDKNTEMLTKAIKACKIYVYIILLCFILMWLAFIFEHDFGSSGLILTGLIFLSFISIIYIFSINYLFKNPIEKYSKWIGRNGLFAPTVKE